MQHPSPLPVLADRYQHSLNGRLQTIMMASDPEEKETRGFVSYLDPMLVIMIASYVPNELLFDDRPAIRLTRNTLSFFPGWGFSQRYEDFAEDLFTPLFHGLRADNLYSCTLSSSPDELTGMSMDQAFVKDFKRLAMPPNAVPFESFVAERRGMSELLGGELWDVPFFRDLIQLTFYGVEQGEEYFRLATAMRDQYERPPFLHLRKRMDVSKTDLRAFYKDCDLLRNLSGFMAAAMIFNSETKADLTTNDVMPSKYKNLFRDWWFNVNSGSDIYAYQGDISSFTANCKNVWGYTLWIILTLEQNPDLMSYDVPRVVFVHGRPVVASLSRLLRIYLYLTWHAPFTRRGYDQLQFAEGGYLGIAMNMQLTSQYFAALVKSELRLIKPPNSFRARIGGDDFLILLSLVSIDFPEHLSFCIERFAGRLKNPVVTRLEVGQTFLPIPFCQKPIHVRMEDVRGRVSITLNSDTKLPEMGHHFLSKIQPDDLENEYISFVRAVEDVLDHNQAALAHFLPIYKHWFVRLQGRPDRVTVKSLRNKLESPYRNIGVALVSDKVYEEVEGVEAVVFGIQTIINTLEEKLWLKAKIGAFRRIDIHEEDKLEQYYVLKNEVHEYFTTHYTFLPPPEEIHEPDEWVNQVETLLAKLRKVCDEYT